MVASWGQLLGLMVFQCFLGQRQPSGSIVLMVVHTWSNDGMLKPTSNILCLIMSCLTGWGRVVSSGQVLHLPWCADITLVVLLLCALVSYQPVLLHSAYHIKFGSFPDAALLRCYLMLFCSHVFVAFSCVQLPNLAILPTHRCCFERRGEEERDEMRGQSFMRHQKLSPHVGD